tara:strand:- start:260 stop:556 length:297 start_codon:yes stop_codon:yes gene_type:complete
MIKLTEIISTAGQYDSDVGKNTISYKLRDVFVNPTHVIMMREDEDYGKKNQEQGLVSGLSKSVKFTRLNLNMGSNVTLKCTVTGTPESVMEKLLQKID